MICHVCGMQNKDEAKFCRKCGARLMIEEGQRTDDLPVQVGHDEGGQGGRRPGRRAMLVGALALVALVVGVVVALALRQGAQHPAATGVEASHERAWEGYRALDEAMAAIEEPYLKDGALSGWSQLPALLDEVERYGHGHPELVGGVDRGADYVELTLKEGPLYLYSPTVEGYAAGGVGTRIVTLEPCRADCKLASPEAMDADGHPADGTTVDEWASEVADRLDSVGFAVEDNVDDGDVTVERLREIGPNQLVVYVGHGSAPTVAHGSTLTVAAPADWQVRQEYWDMIDRGQLVYGEGRLAVTDRFFDASNFASDALAGTDILLLSCSSCRDTRLADALVSLGARTVTGFTERVTYAYAADILYAMLGLDDAVLGLSDVGDDGLRPSFAEALAHAQQAFGDKDGSGEQAPSARAICLPEGSAQDARLTEGVVSYLGAGEGVVARFMHDWYDNWHLSQGSYVRSATPFPDRCLKGVSRDGSLYREIVDAAPDSVLYGNDMSCIIEAPQVTAVTDDTYRVSVRYVVSDDEVSEKEYDELVSTGVREDVWDVTINAIGKVTALRRSDEPTQPTDSHASVASEAAQGVPTAGVPTAGGPAPEVPAPVEDKTGTSGDGRGDEAGRLAEFRERRRQLLEAVENDPRQAGTMKEVATGIREYADSLSALAEEAYSYALEREGADVERLSAAHERSKEQLQARLDELDAEMHAHPYSSYGFSVNISSAHIDWANGRLDDLIGPMD